MAPLVVLALPLEGAQLKADRAWQVVFSCAEIRGVRWRIPIPNTMFAKHDRSFSLAFRMARL